jgi:hypothetical protein
MIFRSGVILTSVFYSVIAFGADGPAAQPAPNPAPPPNPIQSAAPAAPAGMPAAGVSPGTGAPAAPAPPAPGPARPGNVVDYKKFRDPFKEPAVSETLVIKSDLERFPVTDFKVTGVITGPIRMRAMLLAPDGKTHYVAESMKVGTRDGVIVKITTKTVVVREKVVNPLGEVEQFDTEIGIDQAGTNTASTE